MNRQFTEEESRINVTLMKRCSTSVISRDIQIKARYHFTAIKLEKIRMSENTKFWQGYKAVKTVIRY